MFESTIKFILDGWEDTVRFQQQDEGDLIGLPYPYTVPSKDEDFQEMYYWDTYFTNRGLLLSDRVELAKNNCDNLLFMLKRYGFVPNGSRTYFLVGSQPPYLSLMVYDVYLKIKDKTWLKECYETLLTEYDFWQTKRMTKTGLNRYYTMATDEMCEDFLDYAESRTQRKISGDRVYVGQSYRAEGESGWDFTPRFNERCAEYNSVDLNCNLYAYEKLFAYYENELGIHTRDWMKIAAERKALMDKYLFDEKHGIYNDYNFVTEKRNEKVSCASFHPYFVKLADDCSGVDYLCEKLETEYGLTVTEKQNDNYQWAYPNGWAPLHFVAVWGLKEYNQHDKALRIARKYCETVDRCFMETSHLFEKYNMRDGNAETVNEYGLPYMMGWSAGVFLALADYIAHR